ncbi:MAG: hypothetical protein WDN28_33895 [Chthoniobacter sp.]
MSSALENGFGQRGPAAVGIRDDVGLPMDRAAPEDDGHGAQQGIGLEFRGDRVTAFVGQVDIEEDHVGPKALRGGQGALAEVFHLHDEGVGLLEHQLADHGQRGFIVDEQDALLFRCGLRDGGAFRPQGAQAAGDQAGEGC